MTGHSWILTVRVIPSPLGTTPRSAEKLRGLFFFRGAESGDNLKTASGSRLAIPPALVVREFWARGYFVSTVGTPRGSYGSVTHYLDPEAVELPLFAPA